MFESVLSRLTSWLALVLACVIAFAPGASMRLCFEPDGTVALEDTTVPGSCGEPVPDGDGQRFAPPRSACCACLDVPIGNPAHEDAVARAADVVVAFGGPAALVAVERARTLPPDHRSAPSRITPIGPPRAVAHLRSFVLRV